MGTCWLTWVEIQHEVIEFGADKEVGVLVPQLVVLHGVFGEAVDLDPGPRVRIISHDVQNTIAELAPDDEERRLAGGNEMMGVRLLLWQVCLNQARGSPRPWWRHQMETFSVLLALCAGNSPVTGEFPSQRPVTRSFYVFFGLRLNKRWSKQSRRRWSETQSLWLWRHCNAHLYLINHHISIIQTMKLDTSVYRFNDLSNSNGEIYLIPVSQMRAPSGGLSRTSRKLWQDYSSCYMFWT